MCVYVCVCLVCVCVFIVVCVCLSSACVCPCVSVWQYVCVCVCVGVRVCESVCEVPAVADLGPPAVDRGRSRSREDFGGRGPVSSGRLMLFTVDLSLSPVPS